MRTGQQRPGWLVSSAPLYWDRQIQAIATESMFRWSSRKLSRSPIARINPRGDAATQRIEKFGFVKNTASLLDR
jgi:hypothetical protein